MTVPASTSRVIVLLDGGDRLAFGAVWCNGSSLLMLPSDDAAALLSKAASAALSTLHRLSSAAAMATIGFSGCVERASSMLAPITSSISVWKRSK